MSFMETFRHSLLAFTKTNIIINNINNERQEPPLCLYLSIIEMAANQNESEISGFFLPILR